jgi:hypothetical protein
MKPMSANWFAWLTVKSAFEGLCMLAPEHAFASPDRSLFRMVSLLLLFGLLRWCPSFPGF